MLETWEDLQARLFHLGWLGEELPAFVAAPGVWLFREIVREASAVADIAGRYLAECEDVGALSGARRRGGPVDTGTPSVGGGAP